MKFTSALQAATPRSVGARLACTAATLVLSACAMPWHKAPAAGTTLTSTLTSMAAYQRVVSGARACYPWPAYKIEPDYFRPDTKTGSMKLFKMEDLEKIEMVSFAVSPTKDGSTVNLKYRNLMSGFPSAAAAWLNGEPDRCPSR
ncbi:hypothetical protein BH09PSE5_BH09PSE5_02130 [soil metagenome]